MMKRTLLFMSALLMVCASVSAQDFTATWTKAAAPDFLSSVPEADTEFYLYNVGAGAFYTYHRGGSSSPYWGTRASVNDTVGSLVYFSQTHPLGDDYQHDFTEATTSYYLVSDLSGTYYATYVAALDDGDPSWDGIWVDDYGYTYVYFDVEDQGSGQFKLHLNCTAAGYSTYESSDMYLGVADFSGLGSGSTIATQANLVFIWVNDTLTTLGASYSDFNDTWAAVDPDVYDAYIEEAGDQNKAYAAAASLKAAIEAAYEANEGIDLSDIIAVYNNTESTAEELEAAEDAISDAIVDYLKGQATADDPIEMTSALTNPDFSTGDDEGWDYDTDLTAPTVDGTYLNCEVYNATFDVYQEISNLPEGVYRVDIQAFYRAGNADSEATLYWADSTKYNYAILYAQSASLGEQHSSIARAISQAQYEPVFEYYGTKDGTWPDDSPTEDADGATIYIPNSMQGAGEWFDAGYYWNSLYLGIADDDTLLVGFRKETTISYDWTIFDNFRIYYYGDEDAAYQVWAADVLSGELAQEETRTSEYHGAPEAETFNEIIAVLSSATDKETLRTYLYMIVDAQDAFDESVTNYANYVALCEEISAWLTDGEDSGMSMDIDEVAILADYLDSGVEDNDDLVEVWGYPNGIMQYILGYTEDGEETYEGILSADEIAEEYDYLYALYQTAIANALVEGSSLTNMLTNADYSTGDYTGWSYDEDLTEPTVDATYLNCEVWNANFDVYQTITGLPEGLYAVEAQAFYRTDGYADSYTEWTTYDADEIEILTELYLNDFSQPVCNVFEGENEDEDIYGDGVNPGGGYIPNSMSAFLNACEADLYWNTVYGLVTNDTLTVGIRNTEGEIDDRWSIWDNFQLSYQGKNVDALTSVLSDYLEVASEYMNVDAGQPDLEALSTAYDAGEAAIETADGDELYDALYVLISAINTVKASESAYEDFLDLISDLSDALSEYSSTATDEAVETASEVYDTCSDIAADFSLSYTDLDPYVTQLEEAIAALKVPAYDDASDDNPVDFTQVIINPTYDDADDDGWTTATGSVAFNSTVLNAEFYNEAFDFYQDIYSLPAGMYEVRVSAYHRVGTYQNDWDLYEESEGDYLNDESLTAYLYATASGTTVSTPIQHLAAGATDDDDYSSGYYAEDSDGNYHYIPNTMAIGYYYLAQENEDGTKVYGSSAFINVDSDGDVLRIGLYCDTYVSTAWILFDDWELYYYGSDSSLSESDNPMSITSTASSNSNVKTVTGIFAPNGAQLNTYQPGVNIVRMVDGEGNVSTMKVFMK